MAEGGGFFAAAFGNLLRGALGGRSSAPDPFEVAASTPSRATPENIEAMREQLTALRESRVGRPGSTTAPAQTAPEPPTTPEPTQPGATPAPEPIPPPPPAAGGEPFSFPFAGFMGLPPTAKAAAELAKLSKILLALRRIPPLLLPGILLPDEIDESSARLGVEGPVVKMTIPPPGTEGPSQAQFDELRELRRLEREIKEQKARNKALADLEEIKVGVKKRDFPFETIKVTAKPRPLPAPAPAPAGLRIPPGILRNLSTIGLIGAVFRGSRGGTVNIPPGPEIVLPTQPPTPAPTPVPPPVGSIQPVPSLPGTVLPSLSPNFARQAQRDRTRDKECQVVKRRRRRRGKCREGFFREEPGKTTFTTWRTVDCLTGKTLTER